jgi:glutamate racemase
MIGFYDSGIGGMTIAEPFYGETGLQCVYFGDTTNCPLGEKSASQITEIVTNSVQKLFENGCNIVVLACNTATAVCIRYLQQTWLPAQHFNEPKNILGIIQPTNEAILSGCGYQDMVSILATPATIQSGFYQRELRNLGFKNIHGISCVGLALAIEQHNQNEIQSILRDIFLKHKNTLIKSKSLVLACTHYPLVVDIIADELNKINSSAAIISQSKVVVYELQKYIHRHPEYPQIKGEFIVI